MRSISSFSHSISLSTRKMKYSRSVFTFQQFNQFSRESIRLWTFFYRSVLKMCFCCCWGYIYIIDCPVRVFCFAYRDTTKYILKCGKKKKTTKYERKIHSYKNWHNKNEVKSDISHNYTIHSVGISGAKQNCLFKLNVLNGV